MKNYAVNGGVAVATQMRYHSKCSGLLTKNPKKQVIRVDADSANDSKGNIVQLTYRVHLEIGITYTMNLYYTKCKLLINTKAKLIFLLMNISIR